MEITSLKVEASVANDIIVKYVWRMEVSSGDEASIHCKFRLSFFDENGTEIQSKTDFVTISNGVNRFSGAGICNPGVWKRVKEYKAHLTCQ
jgi:hypothetical protein